MGALISYEDSMRIQNLKINILYMMCNPQSGREEDGTVTEKELLDEFSDLPEEAIRSTINAMVADGLIRQDPSNPNLTITGKGIARLQSSVACRRHNDSCCFSSYK
jgi:hypothetical protein